MESILNSVKKTLGGIDPANTNFDNDLIIFINSVFSILTQLGVGPAEGFSINDNTTTWADFFGEKDAKEMEIVKGYVSLKVKLMFDPPANSFTQESIKKVCDEFEWRLNVASETPSVTEEES